MSEKSTFLARIYSSLYWRISFIFLLVLTAMTATYLYITAETADLYFQETSQKVHGDLAQWLVDHKTPFVNGEVNEQDLKETFDQMMQVNPSLEVYLLDTKGNILTYFAPHKVVKLESVPLAPVQQFISDTSGTLILGDDPRHPGQQKIFSAAEIVEEGTLQGYFYVVLASEQYTSIAEMVQSSYRLRLAGTTMVIAFVVAGLAGLMIIWLLTRNLQRIVRIVRRFQKGDHKARIKLKSRGELTQLANDFNDMADTIVEHIDELKGVEALRRELIANVSHDLRTPLAAIQGYAETLVLKSDSLSEDDRQKYARVILQGTERVGKLVQDLFELSKLETQQVEAHFEYFSLPELISDLSQKYELMAEKQGVKMEINIPRNLPPIYADIALIDRVLQNLIDNAMKHTPENGVITVEAVPSRSGMEVRVADTGIGIPKEELPYIFDRYRKGSSRKKDGMGLGLAIVKKILDLHQTTIQVQSERDRGTLFYFQLPIATT